jgi:hypothetical protein
MSVKGQSSSSIDFSYLNDAKHKKGEKKAVEKMEDLKGPSNKERKREEAEAKLLKKKAGSSRPDKASWPKKLAVMGTIIFLCGVGFCNFLISISGSILGDGIVALDVHDTTKLKEVLFGGDPWLVYCVNNETKDHRLPKVLEDSARSLQSSIGLSTGVLPCWEKTSSGRSVAQRFKLRERPPLSFVVANGNKPRTMNLVGVNKAEDIERKAKPALKLETVRIDTLKKWPSHCTTRRACIVVGHKHQAQRDTAMNLIKPLMEKHRMLKIVTLDTSFWSLKLDDEVLKRRPPQVKGSYRADVLCLAREEGAKGNATHRGDFLKELDSRSLSSFFTACQKQEDLVKIGVSPKIKAKPSKPKTVKVPPPPPPPRKSPSPTPPRDPRSSGGTSRANVDSVGSRARMEAAAAEEALFEAVEEDESNDEASEDDSSDETESEGEDVDGESDDSESADDEEVEL